MGYCHQSGASALPSPSITLLSAALRYVLPLVCVSFEALIPRSSFDHDEGAAKKVLEQHSTLDKAKLSLMTDLRAELGGEIRLAVHSKRTFYHP